MKVKMSREQVNSGRIIPNGEYLGMIINIEDSESNAGNPMAVVDIQVDANPEYSGVICRDWLGDWFRGADKLRRFIEALTNSKYDYEKEYDLSNEKIKGRKIKFYTIQGTDKNGQPCNSIQDYKAA